jgi:hypothetical protein
LRTRLEEARRPEPLVDADGVHEAIVIHGFPVPKYGTWRNTGCQ